MLAPEGRTQVEVHSLQDVVRLQTEVHLQVVVHLRIVGRLRVVVHLRVVGRLRVVVQLRDGEANSVLEFVEEKKVEDLESWAVGQKA